MFSMSNQNLTEMINNLLYTAFPSATVKNIQLYFNVRYVILSCKDCNYNAQVTAAEKKVYFLCIEWMVYCGQNNIFKFLAVPTRRLITMKLKITNSAGKFLFSYLFLFADCTY